LAIEGGVHHTERHCVEVVHHDPALKDHRRRLVEEVVTNSAVHGRLVAFPASHPWALSSLTTCTPYRTYNLKIGALMRCSHL